MKNKKTKKILTVFVFFCTFFFLFSLTIVFAQNPPSLENHQFYGRVTWNAAEAGPQQVVAKVGTADFSSSLKDAACSAVTNSCSASYGLSPDTLRVQGKNGDLILFYVDSRLAGNSTYAADQATELNFDVRTLPAALTPASNASNASLSNATNATGGCTPNLNCTGWSSCLNNNQTRTCTDKNTCNVNRTNFNETRVCVPGAIETCEQHWQCTAWSGCVDDERSRTCERDDDCDEKLAAKEIVSIREMLIPSESESCVSVAPPAPTPLPVVPTATCFDNVKNQNEEKVDCGGVCRACAEEKKAEEKKKGLPWYLYAGIGLVVALGILALIYFLVIKSGGGAALAPEKAAQLRGYFQRSIAQGLSKEEIKEKLVRSGWEEKLIKRFLKRENL